MIMMIMMTTTMVMMTMMVMISMTVMMMMHHSKNRGVASNDEGERPETSNSEERKVKPAILSNQMQN